MMITIGMLCLTFIHCIYLYYLLFISLFLITMLLLSLRDE